MPEQLDERLQPLAPIRLHIEPFVIQEPRAVAQAAPPFRHVALDDLRRGVALAAERVLHVTARVIENVAAAPVDELEHAERREADAEAVLDRLVDILGAGDAFLDHARRLVHGERLDARHDVARARRAHDRHLADGFEQRLQARRNRRIGVLAGRDLDQRHEKGRIEPVRVEEALGMIDGGREVIDQNGGRGRCDDRRGSGELRGARQRFALEIEHFRHAFEDDRGGGQCRLRFVLRHDGDARHQCFDRGRIEQPEARERCQDIAYFAEGVARTAS